jgi:hypothetical protein
MDPVTRLRFMARCGARILAFPNDRGHEARRLTDLGAHVRGALERSAILLEARVGDRVTLAGVLVSVLVTLVTVASFLPKWSIPALLVAAANLYFAFWRISLRQSS